MSNSLNAPSFAFDYWRPWKENSDIVESYLDYNKDKSLANYQADAIGEYIKEASTEHIEAIGELGETLRIANYQQTLAIGELQNEIIKTSRNQIKEINKLGDKFEKGIKILSYQLTSLNEELSFLNKNFEINIEQQKAANLLLQNINELLRVPDSEKDRQRNIELGLKFFINAQKDEDLYQDALEELLAAEQQMKQDYFVLHRIGLIYMYSTKQINPEIAFKYFSKAAKYASIESDPKAVRLVSVLAKNGNYINSDIECNINSIGELSADSYKEAAFAAYVLGDFESAVLYQSKALHFKYSAENLFFLSKYQARTKKTDLCIKNLADSIDEKPEILYAIFKDLDLINEPDVLFLIETVNNKINHRIKQLIKDWKKIDTTESKKVTILLESLSSYTYDKKVRIANDLETKFLEEKELFDNSLFQLKKNIPELKNKLLIAKTKLSKEKIDSLTQELDNSLKLPFELMQKKYQFVLEKFQNNLYKIGDKLEDGYDDAIVFYVNDNKCLIIEAKDRTKTDWHIAALSCEYKGKGGWRLPTLDELKLWFSEKKNVGHYSIVDYWSSCEYNEFKCWSLDFLRGVPIAHEKKSSHSFRAVRTLYEF